MQIKARPCTCPTERWVNTTDAVGLDTASSKSSSGDGAALLKGISYVSPLLYVGHKQGVADAAPPVSHKAGPCFKGLLSDGPRRSSRVAHTDPARRAWWPLRQMIPDDPIRLVIVLWVVPGLTKSLLILLVVRRRYWTHGPHGGRRITYLSNVIAFCR